MILKQVYVKNRIAFAGELIRNRSHLIRSVCDLGCRDKSLKNELPDDVNYVGVDIYPCDESVIEANIEVDIPLKSSQYDLVCALDVLEHTNDISNAIVELRRITRNQ